jgi:NAD(P)-dependent dehydrogenase (short-subunit alcohol dehydrogenase family)
MDRMKDKFVVVTGAAHGIGAAIARRFAEEGAALALLDLDGAQLAETAKRLPGAQPLTISADVNDEVVVDGALGPENGLMHCMSRRFTPSGDSASGDRRLRIPRTPARPQRIAPAVED